MVSSRVVWNVQEIDDAVFSFVFNWLLLTLSVLFLCIFLQQLVQHGDMVFIYSVIKTSSLAGQKNMKYVNYNIPCLNIKSKNNKTERNN